MTLVNTTIGVAIVLVIIYIVVSYYYKKETKLSSLKLATVKQEISSSDILNNSNTTNFTYSVWFYVDDWNYRFGEYKTILERSSANIKSSPSIFLDKVQNNIFIEIPCYSKNGGDETSINHKCVIQNFPLQSWVNLIVSLYGRTLDVYMDGKLVRTCMLPGVAKTNPKSDLLITPDGGFKGWTSKVEYWDDSSNPQQAYDIYKAGFGGGAFGNLFNKYGFKFSFMENDIEQSSYEI